MSGAQKVLICMGVVLAGCGGGLASTGDYCLEVDPPVYDFQCEAGSAVVTVSNFCGVEINLAEPVMDSVCQSRVTIAAAGEGALADGSSTAFTLTYTPIDSEVWDCTVAFPHDLAGEPAPEVPLAGGGEACN